jgi:hypothetical protein
MKVRLTYFRRDRKPHISAEYTSAQSSFANVLAEVRINRQRQGKSPGLDGRADCYDIVVTAEGQRAVVQATRPRRETHAVGDSARAPLKRHANATGEDYGAQRKARPLGELLPATRRWAESLPEFAKPNQLLQTYPRIANRIANAWHGSNALVAINDLIVDRRGGRRGLPPFVLAELLSLRHLLEHAAISLRGTP